MRSHPHPSNFRICRFLDRGWGEIAFQYRWDSTGGSHRGTDGTLPDLDHCSVNEFTVYCAGDLRAGARTDGSPEPGWFQPPDPPFSGWRFRNPTDGRYCDVGLESF